MPMGRKVDEILDDNWSSLMVCKDDLAPLGLVGKVGAPRGPFQVLTIYLGSYAF